jgi:hypothetical protein
MVFKNRNKWHGLRIYVLSFIGVGLFYLPNLCWAANNCPWINEATASGLLGGNAVGQVTGTGDDRTTVCEFTEQGAGFKHTLRIAVEVGADAQLRLEILARNCGIDAVPLKAIGNEALICSTTDPKLGHGERVVGRVRNQLFTVLIYTTLNNDPILTREALKIRTNMAAEQISGNLF